MLTAIARLEEIQVDVEKMRAELPSCRKEEAAHWQAVIEEAATRLARARSRLERIRDLKKSTPGEVLH